MNLDSIFKGRLTSAKWAALGRFLAGDYIRSGPGLTVRNSGGRIVLGMIRTPQYPRDTLPPFYPQFGEDENGWYATVTPGYVIDHVTKKGNALSLHTPPGLVGDDGEPKKFRITPDQSVYVVVSVDESGAVTANSASEPVNIEVAPDNKESTHYIPPVGDDQYGKKGTYYYKLAKFLGPDAEKIADLFLAGSHIAHYRELPKIRNADGDKEWFWKYDEEAGEYRIKALTEKEPDFPGAEKNIKLTNQEREIQIKVVGGDLDLEIWDVFYQSQIGNFEKSSAPSAVLIWRNGVFVKKISGTEQRPGAEGNVTIQSITNIVETSSLIPGA